MRRVLIPLLLWTVGVAGVAFAPDAVADDASAPSASEQTKSAARAKYLEGVALVKSSQWSDALVSFEAASKLYPNPQITMSMGSCERALGRYVRARSTLERAIAESATSPSPLPEASLLEAKGFVAEIDRVLARVEISIEPKEAAIAIDGRPLAEQKGQGGKPLLAAGVLDPGPGAPPPASQFTLILDPGVHVFTLSRKGFTDAVVNKTFAPGSSSTLNLKLDLLPATLKVTATEPGALVRIAGVDVGPAPVDVLRPAGAYHVDVKHDGFVPYSTQVTVQPGEEVKLNAALAIEKPSLLTRWWFWTGAAAVVGAGAAATYFATRTAPPPAYDAGSTGWVVKLNATRF